MSVITSVSSLLTLSVWIGLVSPDMEPSGWKGRCFLPSTSAGEEPGEGKGKRGWEGKEERGGGQGRAGGRKVCQPRSVQRAVAKATRKHVSTKEHQGVP